MAKEDALRSSYIKALRHAGSYYATGKETTEELKKQWNNFRSEYRNRTGNSAPSLYTYANASTNDIPTLDLGADYIQQFLKAIDVIYHDTLEYIQSESDKASSIASNKGLFIDVSRAKSAITQEIETYYSSGVPLDIIAQAIADNVELDYTIAIALSPPSDVVILFENTLAQLEGMWSQIDALIQQRAEEMENEYYGI